MAPEFDSHNNGQPPAKDPPSPAPPSPADDASPDADLRTLKAIGLWLVLWALLGALLLVFSIWVDWV